MATSKPTYRVKVTPNYYAGQDGAASDYQACWLGGTSAGGVGTYSMDRLASDEFAGAWLWKPYATWPTGPTAGVFPPAFQDKNQLQGEWGRAFNFHNTSLEPEGFGWSKGPGNSAVAIDFTQGNLILNVDDNATKNYLLKQNVTLGTRHTVAMIMVLGRTDGTTARPGRVRVWFNGAQVLDTGSCNTLWRFGPLANGSYFTQRYMWLWNGFYTRGLHDGYVLEQELAWPWLGRTPSEALAMTTGGEGGSWGLSDIPIPGQDHTLGPATITTLTSWTSDDLVLPAEFGGSAVVPSALTTNTGPWSDVVQWNATETTPPAPPTVAEQQTGPWSDVVQWNASVVPTVATSSLTLAVRSADTLTLTPRL